jgi:CO/xanthine dehydrogenase Mo-binding subunit
MSAIGTRFVRPDGVEKVTGLGRYTADLIAPGMLHGRFRYAAHPHARIRRIETTAARNLPGVLAVITQDDVPLVRYGPSVKDRTLFAKDVVRYEGEIVAAVAALAPEIAEEAVALIEVDYEPLEPVFDAEAALANGAVLVHPEWEAYEQAEGVVRNGNDCAYVNIVKGDVDKAFAEADTIVEERYLVDMSHPVPIEPHAVLAEWHGKKLTVWSTTQVPFAARSGVAETLGLSEANIRIAVPHLGGGFGGKCDFHVEAHAAAMARATGRPVRIVFTRREEFVVFDKARHPMTIELKTGIGSDGTILGRKARLVLDSGAYAADSPVLSEVATMMAVGPYRIPHLLIEAHTVYTNKTPTGSTRAPTGPQVCWAVEQHTDALAEQAGLDPYEFRRRNVVDEGDEGPTGQRFEAIGMKQCLDRAAELIGWAEELPEGEGVGLACGWWCSFPNASGAYVEMNTDGTATVVTGAQENGTGAVMGLALVAAEELGLAPEDVSLVYNSTDAGPYDFGSAGSQTTFNNGRAVIKAAAQVRERLLSLAADELEATAEDLELRDSAVSVRGAPTRRVALADLVTKSREDGEVVLGRGSSQPPPLPENFGGTCAGRVWFPAFAAPSFFCHSVRVAVDGETGVVQVKEVAAAHDFGRVLNPLGAEGQVEGGVAHSIGMALTEGTQFDDEGRQRNPHLLDYKLQTAADVPPIKIVFIEAPATDGGPHGSKGVGEPPVIATAGAVANAIAAATGVRVRRLPMTPERVWSVLHEDRA